jgi:pyruvate,water dikinase
MGIQAFRLVASRIATLLGYPPADPYRGPAPLVEAGDRLFIDVTGAMRSRFGRAFLDRFMGVAEARTSAIFKQLGNDPRFAPRRTNPWSILRAATFLRRTRLPLAATRYLLRPRRAVRTVNRLICELDGLALVSPYNHLAAAERGLRGLPGILVTILPVMLSGLGVFLLARRLLEGRATEDEPQVVLRGLPHNPTTEMDLVLWEMATRVRKDESSRAALAEIDASELSRQYLASKLLPLLQAELSDFLTRYAIVGLRRSTLACRDGLRTQPIFWAPWPTTSGWIAPM